MKYYICKLQYDIYIYMLYIISYNYNINRMIILNQQLNINYLVMDTKLIILKKEIYTFINCLKLMLLYNIK